MKKKYEYKVLLSTWWIRINISGEVTKKEGNKTIDEILINDQFILEDQKEEIQKGIRSALQELKINDISYKVEIIEVEFQLTDVQLEAFYWAAREWLAFTLERDIKRPDVSFDKINNKYIFKLKDV